MKKKGYSLFSVIIIIIITSIVSGLTIGTILTKNSYLLGNGIYDSKDKDLQEFLVLYNKLKDEYYEDVDSSILINGAINGMLSEVGESYTSLLNEESTSNLIENLNGTYSGVGVSIVDNEVLYTVVGSSAEKNGILPGDKIISVNGTETSNLSGEQISELIKNSEDIVNIIINRDGINYTFNLKIETLNIPAVSYQVVEGTNIGYMRISVFSVNVSKEIEKSLEMLKNNEITGLILDLRGNNGGYLDQAYDSASLFTKKDSLIYSLKTKNDITNYKDNNNIEQNIPVIVIVNGSTASAAEILTAALKDSYGATIVGTKTFGKGKVQHTYSLSNGRMAKYTSALWLRPNGECIDKVGINPDYVIENEFIYNENNLETPVVVGIKDNQLEFAKELLSN